MVQARSIGIHHRANIGGDAVIVAVDSFAHAEQLFDIIDRRTVLAHHRACTAPGHCDHLLQYTEVILRMRIGKPVCDIGVGCAVDMRNAEAVPDDFNIIFPRSWRSLPVCKQWLPYQSTSCNQNYKRQQHPQ